MTTRFSSQSWRTTWGRRSVANVWVLSSREKILGVFGTLLEKVMEGVMQEENN